MQISNSFAPYYNQSSFIRFSFALQNCTLNSSASLLEKMTIRVRKEYFPQKKLSVKKNQVKGSL